jgi:hypothetical protein
MLPGSIDRVNQTGSVLESLRVTPDGLGLESWQSTEDNITWSRYCLLDPIYFSRRPSQ